MNMLKFLIDNWVVVSQSIVIITGGVRWWYVGYYKSKNEGKRAKLDSELMSVEHKETMLNKLEEIYKARTQDFEVIFELRNTISRLESECDCVKDLLKKIHQENE